MDSHVFILSRIREGHDQGLPTPEAIQRGITHSAGVITSAAIVMVAVFSTFATLSVISMKQLGERNWYLPRWLDRIIPQHTIASAAPSAPALGQRSLGEAA